MKTLKRGRRPTGLARPIAIQVDVSAIEEEFVSRKSFELKMSKSEFIRSRVMAGAPVEVLLEEVKRLRIQQRGQENIWRPRKSKRTGKVVLPEGLNGIH